MEYDIYRFGPPGDMELSFVSNAKRLYSSYEKLEDKDKLILQLVCHAIIQIKYTEQNLYRKGDPVGVKWLLRCHEQDEYYAWERNRRRIIKPIKKTSVFTYPAYDLIFEGEVILSLQENANEKYEVVILKMEKVDACSELILANALQHAEQYGRR